MDEREPLIWSRRGSSSESSTLQYFGDTNKGGVHHATGANLQHARRLLYVSHFFNQFSEQIWQFSLALFLAAYTDNASIMLVTTYGLVTNLFILFFGSSVGRYIDGSNRLTVARQFIGLENLTVVTATVLCYVLLSKDADIVNSETEDVVIDASSSSLYDLKSVILLIAIHLLGAFAMCLDTGFLVAVERDWVVVMSLSACNQRKLSKEESKNTQNDWLSSTNVKMRQIDLSCSILAPAFAGIFIGLFDNGAGKHHGYYLRGAAVFVGAVNVAALVVEYICTAKIYHTIPDLARNASVTQNTMEEATRLNKGGGGDSDNLEEGEDGEARNNGNTGKTGKRSMKILEDLELYFSQSICWAGFSLALLYLNVALSFGNTLTVYFIWRGISMGEIGFWRGVASAAGLGGTFVYHILAKKVGLVDIGMLSITFEFLCLASCFGALFVSNNDIFFVILIAGVCFSRIGLWVFDISVTQLMQFHVPAPIRGLVGGVQNSLNSFFTVIIYVVGLFLSDPHLFNIYASVSIVGVTLAAIFYGVMVFPKKAMFLESSTSTQNN